MAFRIHRGVWQFKKADGVYESKYKLNDSGQLVETDVDGNEIGGMTASVAWTSVSGRPTALSGFTNDLGNYGGWLTTSGKAADANLLDGVDSSAFIRSNANDTVSGRLDFTAGESMRLYGIRGQFTNEYIHLYHKVGIGHPGGWGQGEGNTPGYGLSIYGGMNIAYGNNAPSTFNGDVKANNLQLSSSTPTIWFNGTGDGSDGAGSDMAIKATPEGLDFFEPEDGNKIHFQILDDTGVNAPYGYKVGAGYVVNSSGAWVGANLAENQINWVTPSTPTLVSKNNNGDAVQFTFNQSNGQYYEIWSSVGNTNDYALIGKVDPNSVTAQMTFLDSTINTNSATVYYRVYAINKGIYGVPLEFNHAFSWSAPDIVPTSNVVMDFILVSWEKPASRLVKGFTVKMHAASGTPAYASASVVASTTNTMFVYNVPSNQLDYNHEFWIEPIY